MQFTKIKLVHKLKISHWIDYIFMNSELVSQRDLKPLVAIATDTIERSGHRAYSLFFGYIDAVAQTAQALPLALPSDPQAIDYNALLSNVDGILLTGSPSNVSPYYYGQLESANDPLLDLGRDKTILPLIRPILEAGIPLLGICRGFQEINVAMGGTLNPSVFNSSNAIDHREGDRSRPIVEWYRDSHSIEIMPEGILATLTKNKSVKVNSLHHQGIETLGHGLKIEAKASDGLIEAFSVKDAKNFALAVQWHPEMRTKDDPLSKAIFQAFGDACRQRMLQRLKK